MLTMLDQIMNLIHTLMICGSFALGMWILCIFTSIARGKI